MVQPEHGGGRVATAAPVAYFEALPNEVAEEVPVTFDAPGSHQQRRVDLTRFAGRTMRSGSSTAWADAQFVNAYRMSWYVDDIRLVSGSFEKIGRTTEKRFLVQNRHKGEWTYRVRALFGERQDGALERRDRAGHRLGRRIAAKSRRRWPEICARVPASYEGEKAHET